MYESQKSDGAGNYLEYGSVIAGCKASFIRQVLFRYSVEEGRVALSR